MSDLISRQAAIDAIRKSTSEFSGFMEMEMYTDDDAVEAINGVPSAEPVRHGKWITCTSSEHWKCSECGCRAGYWFNEENSGIDSWEMDFSEWLSDYCPNCGARMDAE